MNNKVSTSTEKKNNGLYKTIRNGLIAGSLFLTLGSQPAEAKITEKNIDQIEMTSENNSENLLGIENVENFKVTDYFGLAEKKINSYYPERKNYFSTIINAYKNTNENNIRIFNIIINEEINNSEINGKIKSEKDIVTTALYTLDGFTNEKIFLKDKSIRIIDSERGEDIRRSTGKIVSKRVLKKMSELNEKSVIANNKNQEMDLKNKSPEEIINGLEICYMKVFEIEDLKYWIPLQNRIKIYIELSKKIGKEPSQLGKQRIAEYERINN